MQRDGEAAIVQDLPVVTRDVVEAPLLAVELDRRRLLETPRQVVLGDRGSRGHAGDLLDGLHLLVG
jgi:hypothetical protein